MRAGSPARRPPGARHVPDMVIIADDLSGAADCGIACASAGHETIVVLGERPDEPACGVLAIDADTRGRSRAEAAAETARLTRLHAPPGRRLFRKLDSTLRGHVAAELAALLAVRRESGPAVILLAPAFPATGRTTRDGIQRLDGLPLQTPRSGSASACRAPRRCRRCWRTQTCAPSSSVSKVSGRRVCRARSRRCRLPPMC